MTSGWPATLRALSAAGTVTVRPLRRRDARAWSAVRARNGAWLEPWEATSPTGAPAASFGAYVAAARAHARAGTHLPFVIELDGRLVGQVTVASIVRGSACTASIGYWIDSAVAGRGIVPTAVALVIDHCFAEVGLHRIEIAIRPENAPSLRVVAKLGLREEGVRERFLHIDGRWRDHRVFAVTSEEVPGGLLARLRERAESA
ncbi:GNAT family N-acetyltransferase [Flavimobilis sp. GY10621]|uniref:GNAT family N-acetyltransferase n=1 Tax=Flavimobilis rhizosphaerae TaxID=2775421 RepID=A0ABR9DM63_9MICO|nr:GNAT family protein [Flavimobilis rhizosphaerae]MBD9698198.1 GNAT family N-acetyltransferase [Flavimobilis rhizosphaerae]